MPKTIYTHCLNCNTKLVKYQTKYCSFSCQGKYQWNNESGTFGNRKPKALPTNHCEYCGILTINPKYCSQSCSAKMNNKIIDRRENNLKSGKYALKPCKICNIQTINMIYCSSACDNKDKRQRRFIIMEKTNNYKKSYLLNELGNQCQRCGITDYNNEPITIELEHIDGNSKPDLIYNLRLSPRT